MKKQLCLVLPALFLLLVLFFNPSFFKGWLPFPGDLLAGHYSPWNSYSFAGFAPGGIPHKAQGIDVVRQFFPWRFFSTQMLKKGQLPLWNPYNFAGNPHLANFQSAVFNPLALVFFLPAGRQEFLPFNLAWTIFIMLQPFLAGLFTFLFLKELKLSAKAALFASLSFSYCLYLTVWLEWGVIGQSLLWLPLTLFLIEKLIHSFKWYWWGLLVFCLTASILAGYIQTSIYLFVVVYLYFFFRLFSSIKKEKRLFLSAIVFLSGILALGLSGIQLWPTWELFINSARQAYPTERIPQLLLPKVSLVTALVPDFFGNPASRNYWLEGTYIERVLYIGVLPFFFALGAFIWQRKNKLVIFFALLSLLALFLSVDWWPARLFHQLQLPIISTTVPTRILWVWAFGLAVLSGLGMEYFLSKKKPMSIKKLAFLSLAVYLLLWLSVLLLPRIIPQAEWIGFLTISRRNLVIPSVVALSGLFLVLFFPWPKLIYGGIVFLTVFDLFFYFQKITPLSPAEFVYPSTSVMEYLRQNAGLNRFWGYGTAYIEANFSTLWQNFSAEGYDPLFIRRYGELIFAAENGKVISSIPRADVYLPKGYGTEGLRTNPYRQRLLNLLGIKYLLYKNESLGKDWLADEATFAPEIYRLVWQETPWQIYENKEALPRIFITGSYRVESQPQKIINLILSQDFDLEKELILEEALPADFILDREVEVKISELDYQPNRVKLRLNSSGNGLLFVSDNYYPGWQAKVDGVSAKIYRADYSFRAVPVSAGEHLVEFVYQPKSFKIGAEVSLLALGATFIILIWLRKKQG
jgi:hypothetical protein